MDEIEKRLRETSDNCFTCYEVWRKDQKSTEAREALQESIHEVRKVASRLEIELAISERDQMAQKPIPIPPHRDSERKGRGGDNADDNVGNRQGGGEPASKKPMRSRKGPPKKSGGPGNGE